MRRWLHLLVFLSALSSQLSALGQSRVKDLPTTTQFTTNTSILLDDGTYGVRRITWPQLLELISTNANNVVATNGLISSASGTGTNITIVGGSVVGTLLADRIVTDDVALAGASLSNWLPTPNIQQPIIPATGNLYTFGDSQTFGSQLDDAGFTTTDRYEPEYRWPNIFASGGSAATTRSLSLTNYGISGSLFSWRPVSSSWLRQSPLNLIGENLPLDWVGISTLMIGYNNLGFMISVDPNADVWQEEGVAASAARLLIDNYAAVGKNPDGSSFSSWSTTGSTISWAYTDNRPFKTGASTRQATELTGSETLSLTIPAGASHVFVFTETTPYTGGAINIATNGRPVGTVTNLGYVNTVSTVDFYPKVFTIPNPKRVSFDLSISNAAGTNTILGIGWVTNASQKQVIIGGVINAPNNPSQTGSGGCLLWNSASAAAAGRLSDLPVFFADVFGAVNPESHFNPGDPNHLNRPGQGAVALAFEKASKLDDMGRRTLAITRKNTQLTWNRGIEQIYQAGRSTGNATNGAAVFRAVSSPSSTKGLEFFGWDALRWSLWSYGPENGTNSAGSNLYLSGWDVNNVRYDYISIFRNQSFALMQGPWTYYGEAMYLGRTNLAGVLAINGPYDSARNILFRTSNTNRWRMGVTGVETGIGNAGSNFVLESFSDAQVSMGFPFQALRAGPVFFKNSANFGTSSDPGAVHIDGPATANKYLRFLSNSIPAFQLGMDTNRSFYIQRYDLGGTNAGFPFQIIGSSGDLMVGEGTQGYGLRVGGGTAVSKWLSATNSWDPPNLTSGSISSTNITVTGISGPGAWAAVASLNSIGSLDVMISASVATNNVVRVIIQNVSGSDVDLLPGTVTASAWTN